jgi:redox-sensitive bicupin YhaK (pirin superfamily)
MIRVIKANKRRFSDFGWLKTYWLFSFSDYYDPENIQFGALRVFNDDVVEPGMGFPTHPHQEMEIVTMVLEGEMTHRDSMGNRTVIKAGDVQRMSAGKGFTHSEFNLGNRPVHFYQIWIYPDKAGLAPTYDQRSFADTPVSNNLLPVASGQKLRNVVTFNTAATIYAGNLEAAHDTRFKMNESRRIFVYITRGEMTINDTVVKSGDQARIDLGTSLAFKAQKPTDFILIDVPSCKGWGYDSKILKGARERG